MLQNAYLVAKIGADTAENEQHFAEILPVGRRGLRGRNPSGFLPDDFGAGAAPLQVQRFFKPIFC